MLMVERGLRIPDERLPVVHIHVAAEGVDGPEQDFLVVTREEFHGYAPSHGFSSSSGQACSVSQSAHKGVLQQEQITTATLGPITLPQSPQYFTPCSSLICICSPELREDRLSVSDLIAGCHTLNLLYCPAPVGLHGARGGWMPSRNRDD